MFLQKEREYKIFLEDNLFMKCNLSMREMAKKNFTVSNGEKFMYDIL
jgi:hypothetical protein